LISGFLGSGKTTFLSHLLPQLGQAGFKPALIINDYGQAEIDAAILGQLAASVRAINGTCVCCESQNDFLNTLAQEPLSEKSLLLVETNGTTEPIEIIEALALDPRARRYHSPRSVGIIDALRWQKRWWHNALERDQARTATHLYLSKSDLAEASRLEHVRHSLQALNPSAQWTTPENLAKDLQTPTPLAQPFSDSSSPHPIASHSGQHAPHHHEHSEAAHGFASCQISLPAQVPRPQLETWLRNLPREVIRAKGFVRFSEEPEKLYTFQKVEESQSILFLPLDGQFAREPLAVLIGVGLTDSILAFP
jgi:G3E family GTPase